MTKVSFVFLMSSLAFVVGCNQEQASRGEGNDLTKVLAIEQLEAIIAMRKTKTTDEVAQYLVNYGEFPQSSFGPELLVLRSSEEDVKKLPREKRAAFQSQVIEILPVLKEFGYKCIDEGNKLLKKKNALEAKKYFNLTKQLGETLAASERAEVFHTVGRSFITASEKGLSIGTQLQAR